MPPRVALYTRVSTEDQAREGFSLDAQLERLRLYAKAQGWEIAGEYVDEGHSGRTTKRPAYAKMMAERAGWDTLLVLKMDRIHRNSRNFMAMMDQLMRESKGFASVTESLDTGTAMGRFVMDIIQRIAQLESEQIGERVHVGMEQKAKTGGGSLGKAAPFGYRYGAGGRLEVVPEERPWVEGLFRRFAEGASKQRLADWLNEAGVATRGKTRWTVWNVTHILTNPVYAGVLHWEDHLQAGAHEAVVEPRLFDSVQDLISARSPRRRTYRLTRLAGPTA
ncbi:MAG TPA: recombinase family protein [Candidatus Thermoplasmatota archaeon]|nr:recombinase family protein [Candidatus Thermoplasmatota archaeon]